MCSYSYLLIGIDLHVMEHGMYVYISSLIVVGKGKSIAEVLIRVLVECRYTLGGLHLV